MTSTRIETLPRELIRMIFRILSPKDLNSVVLVCRMWREIGEDPGLWTRLFVTLANRGGLEKLYLKRLQKVHNIHFRVSDSWKEVDLNDLFKALIIHPGLRKISGLTGTNLSSVEPELLASVVNRLEVVFMGSSRITKQQGNALFEAISRGGQLKELRIVDNVLSSVEPEVLATAVTKLEIVDIGRTFVTPEQANSLFEAISRGGQLKELGIDKNVLSSIEPAVLATAVTKLEIVDIGRTFLTHEQACHVFTAICKGGNTLKVLNIAGQNLSTVDPTLLSLALTNLEEVTMNWAKITNQQAENLFETICNGGKLKRLNVSKTNLSTIRPLVLKTAVKRLDTFEMGDMSGMTIDQITTICSLICQGKAIKSFSLVGKNLMTIPADVLAKAVNRVENVYMISVTISADQAKQLFLGMIGTGSCVRTLHISENNLSSVSPAVLASAFSQREKVIMGRVVITGEQLQVLMEAISSRSKLKSLRMSNVQLSSVEPTVLARAVTVVEEVFIYDAKITIGQAEALFTMMSQTNQMQLKKLNVADIDLSRMEPAVLAKAVHRLEDIVLVASKLSAAQISCILGQWGEEDSRLRKLRLNAKDIKYVDPDIVKQAMEKRRGLVIDC